MRISIVTVCKNSEAYIEQAIQSVLAQTYGDIEYIVIDGQSGDRTLNIIENYRESIACLVSEPDDGIYQAMNKGIIQATGDFIYFLNSDDFLHDSNVIQDVVDFIVEKPSCDFLYGQMKIRPQSGDSTVIKPKPPNELLDALIFLEGPQHPASIFRRRLFYELGTFDESYYIAADYEWFLRLAQRQKDFAIHYYPRIITSFSSGGVSNLSQGKAVSELFRAQNQLDIYQSEEWLLKRIERLQQLVIKFYDGVQSPLKQPNQAQANPHASQTSLLPESTQVSATISTSHSDIKSSSAESTDSADAEISALEIERKSVVRRVLKKIYYFLLGPLYRRISTEWDEAINQRFGVLNDDVDALREAHSRLTRRVNRFKRNLLEIEKGTSQFKLSVIEHEERATLQLQDEVVKIHCLIAALEARCKD